jgi:hypothetical protein
MPDLPVMPTSISTPLPVMPKPGAKALPVMPKAPAQADVLQAAQKFTQLPRDPISKLIAPPLGWLNDKLQRLDEANLARHSRGGAAGVQTFQHSEDPAQFDQDAAVASAQLMGMSLQDFQKLPNWRQVANKVATEFIYDPLNILGTLGLGEKAVATTEAKLLPGVMNTANKASAGLVNKIRGPMTDESRMILKPTRLKLADKHTTEVSHAPKQFVPSYKTGKPIKLTNRTGLLSETDEPLPRTTLRQNIASGVETGLHGAGMAFSWLHNQLGVDGYAKQYLAKKFGNKWVDEYANLNSLRGGGSNVSVERMRVFDNQITKALSGLTGDQKMLVFRALNKDVVGSLKDQAAKAAGTQISNLTDSLAHYEGTKGLQKDLGAHGFTLPDYAKPLAPTRALGLQKSTQYRRGYLPQPHELDVTAEPASFDADVARAKAKAVGKPSKYSSLKANDPHLNPRGDNTRLVNDPAMYEAELRDRVRSAMVSVQGKEAKNALAKAYGQGRYDRVPLQIKKFFEKEFVAYKNMTVPQKLALWAKTGTDFGKAGQFITPLGHGGNVSILALLNNPTAFIHGVYLYAKNAGKSPEAVFKDYEDAIRAGATSSYNVERQSPFIQALKSNKITRPLGAVYAWSGKQLWAFDDAQKVAAFRAFKRQGMSPERAAYETGAKLVDYSTRSPVAEYSRAGLAPFATYRSKMPMAVARSVLSHPEYAANLGRISPAQAGGTAQQQPGLPGYFTGYGPLAETAKLGEPGGGLEYLRSSMSPGLRVGANVPANAFLDSTNKKNPENAAYNKNYFTYGQEPGTSLLQNLPGLAPLQDLTGTGPFGGLPADQRNIPGILKNLPKQAGANLLEQATRMFPAKAPTPPSAGSIRFNHFMDAYKKTHPKATMKQINEAYYLYKKYSR